MEGKYLFCPERGEWMGVVCDGNHVLDVGCEPTETGIKAWLRASMRQKPWLAGHGIVADIYKRANSGRNKP